MRSLLVIGVLLVTALGAAAEPPLPDYGPAVAEPDQDVAEAPPAARREHANPRLKVSYRRFGVGGLDGGLVPLDGAQVDFYPVSRRWFRLGIELEGGAGDTVAATTTAHLRYGLLGVSAGLQYPARVTPFVEGRAAVGVLGGSLSGTVTVAGTSVSAQGVNAATLLYLGGIDAGIELYAVGRTYVSVALGWAHPVYLGLSPVALQATGSTRTAWFRADTFTFKVGIGF